MTLVERLEDDSAFIELAQTRPLCARIICAAFQRVDSILHNPLDPLIWQTCADEFEELTSWLGNEKPRFSEADIIQSFEENLKAGWTVDLALKYQKLQTKSVRGRPRTDRLKVLEALEYKQAHQPEPSWRQLAIRYCHCRKPDHNNEKCETLVRIRVRGLENKLRALGV